MSLDYLHFDIFGMAVMDMATSTGSISKRLSDAHAGYFYKINWDQDLEIIPDDCKSDFLALKQILHDEVLSAIEKEREGWREKYAPTPVSEEWLGRMSNGRTVIKNFHWTKAKRAAVLITNIYHGLGLASQYEICTPQKS